MTTLESNMSQKPTLEREVHPQALTDPDVQEGRPPARGLSGSFAHDLPQHHACVRRSHVARQ